MLVEKGLRLLAEKKKLSYITAVSKNVSRICLIFRSSFDVKSVQTSGWKRLGNVQLSYHPFLLLYRSFYILHADIWHWSILAPSLIHYDFTLSCEFDLHIFAIQFSAAFTKNGISFQRLSTAENIGLRESLYLVRNPCRNVASLHKRLCLVVSSCLGVPPSAFSSSFVFHSTQLSVCGHF